jgi:hypothetical protein
MDAGILYVMGAIALATFGGIVYSSWQKRRQDKHLKNFAQM